MTADGRAPRRVAVVGNAGSGKTTLARRIAATEGLVHLDLDRIVWEPKQIAVARDADAVRADLDAFCSGNAGWVVEGCYGKLIARALEFGAELVFIDPGEAVCLARCRARPFEAHKFSSPEEQEAWLEPLLHWVRDYYRRDDECSFAFHRRLYDGHAGARRLVGAGDEEPPVMS